VAAKPENPSDIARAINELSLLSEEDRHTMGDNGKRHVLNSHQYCRLAELLDKAMFQNE
jgi:uncharacterized protein (UPF0216 family)